MHLIVISGEELSEEEKDFYQTYTEKHQVYQMRKSERIVGAVSAIFSVLPIQVGLYYSRTLQVMLQQ